MNQQLMTSLGRSPQIKTTDSAHLIDTHQIIEPQKVGSPGHLTATPALIGLLARWREERDDAYSSKRLLAQHNLSLI